MKQKLYIFGGLGEWGRHTIYKALSQGQCLEPIVVDRKEKPADFTGEYIRLGAGQASLPKVIAKIPAGSWALIATPPMTHLNLVERLLDNPNLVWVLCEKPFPDIARLAAGGVDTTRFRLIDHYLEKDAAGRLKTFFFSSFRPLSSYQRWVARRPHAIWRELLRTPARFRILLQRAEIDIIEDQEERRDWMWQSDQFGGVIYDLGHHALAMLAQVFGYDALEEIKAGRVTILEAERFAGGPAVRRAKILFHLREVAIILRLAKNSKQASKEVRLYHNFLLDGKLNRRIVIEKENQYARSFIDCPPGPAGESRIARLNQGSPALLDLDQAMAINAALKEIGQAAHDYLETKSSDDRIRPSRRQSLTRPNSAWPRKRSAKKRNP